MRKIMVLIMSLMVGSAFAASTHLSLDNRTGTRVAAAAERICFSPAWESESAGATAVVSTNGVAAKSATEAGAFDWTPAQNGTYQLTHAVYVNGVQVGETLTATFVKGVAPRSCDWTTGAMELGWFADAKNMNAITYDVYWSESDDPASCVNKPERFVGTKVFAPSKIGVQELTIKDDKYLMHGDGLQPIYYHVVGTDGSWSFCVTRRRFGLFVGYTNYEYDSGKSPESLPSSIPEANDFWNKFILAGGVLNADDAICKWDADAKRQIIDETLTNFCAKVGEGDIFVLYDLTHGRHNLDTDEYDGMSCYDGAYSINSLGNRLDQIGRKGAAVITISGACGSGSMAERCGTENNKAWITATTGKQSGNTIGKDPYDGFNFSHFGRAFLEWGWGRELAGGTDSRVTYYDLASYASNVVEGVAYDRPQQPNYLNENLLRKIVAFTKTSPRPEMRLSAPEGLSVQQQSRLGTWNANLQISWMAETKKEYKLRWRSGDANCPTDGWRRVYVDRTALKEITLPDSQLTDFVPEVGVEYYFKVCAVNSAGEGEYSEEVSACLKPALKTVVMDFGSAIYQVFETGLMFYKLELSPSVSAFELTLPRSIDGIKVVAIGSQAVAQCGSLVGMTIPDGVESIEEGAFDGCNQLRGVVFGGSLPSGVISSGMFDHVTEVYYPRKYAAQYEAVVPSELFAGYTDDVGEGLVIETEQLPSVMEMEEYEEQLECSGGTEPYRWSMDEADYLAVAEESTFAEVGEAQGWYEDEGEWRYDLPFAFNFGGRVYDSVVVHDNACLYFVAGSNTDAIEMDLGDLYSESEDQDIFIERAADHVTFRWKRVLYSNRAADVNCAITLNADGTIRCSFGDSSYDSRQVWLSTARNGAEAEQFGADDIVFEPNYLPLGLRLDEETGVIYGAPEQSGHYAFNVYVSDGEGAISSKGVTLDVEANPNLRPVAEDWDHADEHIALRGGESWAFSVSVSDPEDAALTYCWYYDGFVVPGATGSSFVLQTDKDMRGWHSLICEASDGVWFIDAGTWSFAIGGEQFVTSEDGADGLQVAVDNAVDGDVIYVGPGTYSPIENSWRESVRIIATDGYANTIIDGGGAASCVSVAYVGEDTNRMVRLEGFTLRNGCGEWGGGAQYAWLVGCVVSDNEAEYNGGGLYGGRADSCLIVGNSAPHGGGACQAALYNCTVVENCAEISGGGVIVCEDIGNMIVWRNYEDGALDPVTTVEGDPLFVDAENGDYRLAEGSPYIDAGDNSYVTSATDLDGKARIVKGRVDVGCYEYQGGTAELIETIVPGEKVEIDTGFDGCTVTGLPSGLKYNKSTGMITGVVTKPTAAEGAVVKFTKSGAETEELTIIVTAIPTVKVLMEGVNSPSDTDGCKVTGEGAYLVDKKVTLKASAPKGTVFVGWFDGGNVVATQNSYSFTMDKKDVALVAKFKKEVMSVGCETLSSKESFPAGVLGAEGGIKLDITTESGVKSVKVDKLPAGMKYDSKTGLIIGAPTKACDNKVVITVTANSGAVTKKEIEVCVAAMPVMAVGTFNGFVSVGEDNFGTFTLTTTDAGKLTAKVVTAAGTVSFSGTCWDAVEEGVYRATLTTKKGEKLTLTLDSTAAWDANQLSGEFTTVAAPSRTYAVSAQRNAFGKTWYFAATGDETTGWEFAYTEDTKGAALTMTLKADGSISIAGKLPNGTDTKGKAVTIKVSASGYANVGGLKDGAILADFAPVLTVNKAKTVLAITTNLWFDRKNEVGRSVGAARFVK